MVRTLPSLRVLRAAYPLARISWLVERGAAGVLEGREELDAVIEFPRAALEQALRSGRLRALWRESSSFVSGLRSEQFDLVIDFHAILKSGLIAWLSGSPMRVSYGMPFGRETSWLFATHRARLSPPKMNRYDRNAGLLEFLALDPRVSVPTMKSGAASREAMARALGSQDDFVLIHPGSSGGARYKRYRPSGYAGFARVLWRAHGLRSRVVVGTSEEERALAEEVVALSDGGATLAPETPQLADLIALIERARCFVGSDSGPLHIATALGTRCVQLLGPTDPVENEPRGTAPWKRVRIDVPCSPCRRGCADATCMKILPHELVVAAALELLGETEDRVSGRLRSAPVASAAFAAAT